MRRATFGRSGAVDIEAPSTTCPVVAANAVPTVVHGFTYQPRLIGRDYSVGLKNAALALQFTEPAGPVWGIRPIVGVGGVLESGLARARRHWNARFT